MLFFEYPYLYCKINKGIEMIKKNIELLAPAKDLEVGIAAIDAGADAVYIGAFGFGARQNAANNIEDIEKLVNYAHKFNVRVYVTVNTLLFSTELEAAQKLIWEVYEAKVDGIIIQDTGILEMSLPPIKIIASTQMNNESAEKINFFGNLGINRFILPRELSVCQIKELKSKISPDLEMECFIHGALCVCYSGQCYLSWSRGGRSGNRGSCAQPCRNVYSLKDESGHIIKRHAHLLSLKDLSLEADIPALLDAGVSAFKIEGRLKDKNYVVNAVSYYRNILDKELTPRGLKRSSSGISVIKGDFVSNINKTFNRGFSRYFINGISKESITAMDTPTMKGELVGIVKEVLKKKIVFDRDINLSNGDGICFFNSLDILKGTNVNNVLDNRSILLNEEKPIKEGMEVYRNLDANWLRAITKSEIKRYVTAVIIVSKSEGGIDFNITDEDGYNYILEYKEELELASNTDKARSNIHLQLTKKSTDSYISCNNAEINLEEIPFFPISVLNNIRRQLYKGLEEVRSSGYRVEESHIKVNDTPYITDTLTYKDNVANKYAEAFYKRHQVKNIAYAPETGLSMKGREVMKCKYCVRRELGMCNDDKSLNKPLYLYNDDIKLRLIFSCGECHMRIQA